MPLTVITRFSAGDNRLHEERRETGFCGRTEQYEMYEMTQESVGAGLLPQGICWVYKVSVRRFTKAPGSRLEAVLRCP